MRFLACLHAFHCAPCCPAFQTGFHFEGHVCKIEDPSCVRIADLQTGSQAKVARQSTHGQSATITRVRDGASEWSHAKKLETHLRTALLLSRNAVCSVS